ncbi:MAG: DUF1015 domain-containing protein [Planctomycetes bacterium]|nr:DUF1015 domain-containing protein [Planctomycetota bacterium]MBI3844618.1 DUF1015 domain-containing protein [Planctomycetota bacterium]
MSETVDVRPLRGVRFAGSHDVSHYVCPPYDRIPDALRNKLYAFDPHNAVRLTFPRPEPEDGPDNDRYGRAAKTLRGWLDTGTLKRDSSPSLYVYDLEFEVEPGVRRARRAILALIRLSPFSNGIILPHEETLPGPKIDRMNLLRATGGAQFGPVFLLYFKKRRLEKLFDEPCARPADAEARTDTRETHRLWVVADSKIAAELKSELRDERLVVADGHHRYTTAVEYRDERRREAGDENPEASYEFRLVALVDGDSDSLVIRPTHRILELPAPPDDELLRRRLETEFTLRAVPLDGDAGPRLVEALAAERAKRARAYAIAAPGSKSAWVASRPRVSAEDDVTFLHRLFESWEWLPRERAEAVEAQLRFEKDPTRALERAQAGEGIAFLVNPIDVEDVRTAAQIGRRLPQKSTDFHPKFLSGMVSWVPDPAPVSARAGASR